MPTGAAQMGREAARDARHGPLSIQNTAPGLQRVPGLWEAQNIGPDHPSVTVYVCVKCNRAWDSDGVSRRFTPVSNSEEGKTRGGGRHEKPVGPPPPPPPPPPQKP